VKEKCREKYVKEKCREKYVKEKCREKLNTRKNLTNKKIAQKKIRHTQQKLHGQENTTHTTKTQHRQGKIS
jgi:hypothetical protein